MKSAQSLSHDRTEDMEKLKYSRRNRPEQRIHARGITLVISSLLSEYRQYRENEGQRKIRKNSAAYFVHLHIIVADLYAAWQSDPNIYIGYSRGKQNFLRDGCYWDFSRDEALLSHRIYLNLIDFLDEEEYIENHIATKGRNPLSSRMRALPKLVEQLQPANVTWANVQADISKSAIVVKDENKQPIAPPDDSKFDLKQAEANLRRLNENLQTSLINLNITDGEHEALRRRMRQSVDDGQEPHDPGGQREPLDFTDRRLKRIFALGSFDCGGRFYGGWWHGVPSEYRKFIEIEGCITTEMDYATMQCRVLYARAKVDPPPDSYIVQGWDEEFREITKDEFREVTKKAFNQLLNSKEESRDPKQWHRFAPNIEPKPIPEDWHKMNRHQRSKLRRAEFRERTGREYNELLHDLKQMHTPIDQFFFSQAWKWLQRIDSDIAEKVMLKLLDQAYTALPIHDSFIVRRDAEGSLREAMNEAFEEVIGVAVEVDREATVYDGHSGGGLVDLYDLHEQARVDLFERSGYYGRFAEWQRTWGPRGYE